MDRLVARQNIAHFQRLLETETDPAKRAEINLLLIDEQEKLRLALAVFAKSAKADPAD